jgi:hypothetical protein
VPDVIYPAAVPQPKTLPELLCDLFIYQKTLALERSGMDPERIPKVLPQKAWQLYGDAMTKMAAIVERWNTDPSVMMEACFAYSRSKRHMDGPQLNMLGSPKYLLQAIAYHLEIPKESAADMVSKDAMIRRLTKEAALHEASLRRFLVLKHGSDDRSLLLDEANALDVAMFHSIPPLHRFLYNVLSRPLAIALIPDVLVELRVNAGQRLWAQHCGWSYRGMADYYRVICPRDATPPT